MSSGIACRYGLDLALWLWWRLAAAAPIQPLAQELPYVKGDAIKKKKKNTVAGKTWCDFRLRHSREA